MKNLKLTALTAALLILSVPAMSMTEEEVRQRAGLEDESSQENFEKELKEELTERTGYDTSQTNIKHEEIEQKAEQEEEEIRKGKENKSGLFSVVLNLF